jgi:crotonobetainyl-CoA:carnitine CoA-transferase CaiB-like acyl-CoA transferase
VSSRRDSAEHAPPLQGIRVLDLTRLLPGAYATLLLADLGADVIKIEDPRGGDGMRTLPPLANGRNVYFEALNRNKRSLTLNLRSPEAAAVLGALAARSDVIIDSFRPSTARRLGVDAKTLQAAHPRLVCAAISGFGQSGPYEERAAHDINYQALAGLLRPPALPGPLVGDIGAAMQAALGILAAIIRRERTGAGSLVDVSIHEAALMWSMFPATGDLANACYSIYETADGEWLALGALEPKFWAGFCERIGHPELTRLQHAEDLERARVLGVVRDVMRSRTRDEWLAQFAGADVCLTTIYKPEEVAADPHLVARGVVPNVSGIAHVTPPGGQVRPAPALGADTDAVLDDAGIGAAERSRLRTAGVI